MKKLIFTLLTLLLCVCSGAWAESVTAFVGDGTTGTTKIWNYSTADIVSVSNGSGGMQAGYTKVPKGTSITITGATGVTITAMSFTAQSGYNSKAGVFSVDQGTITGGGVTDDVNNALTWSGSANTIVVTNGSSGSDWRLQSIVITYTASGKTSLTGSWSDAAPSFAVGSAATIPTFTVTGGGTLNTDYTVAYTKTDASGVVTLTDGNGVISAINTAAAATATVTATVTIVNTEDYEMATTSYDCAISVIDATPYSAPTITEKNGTVQITSPDDGVLVSQIKYSLDNGDSWNTYSIPFNLATATTVKAKVVTGADPSKTDSDIASEDCDAIPAAAAGSLSITLFKNSNWTESASQDGSSTKDTWTGKASTDFEGYVIVLDNDGKTGGDIKALSTGNTINSKTTIKGSNGRKLTFTLPTGVKVNRITVYSYTNGDNANHYASGWTINGSAADMIGLSLQDNSDNNGKSESSASNPDVRVFSFDTPLEGSFEFNNSGYQQCFYMVLDYTQTVTATIGATGWTTFASTYPLNLTTLTASSGTATAYYASTAKGSSVTMTSTTATVRAGEGLALKGTPNATVTIPVAASGTAIDGNKLKGCTTSTALAANSNYYVLVNNNNTAEFQRLDTNGATIPAGKAYLDLTGVSLAPTLSIVFEDETSGIDEVRSQKEGVKGAYYNLAGQRVAQPTKGLYIVNGRKVVIK